MRDENAGVVPKLEIPLDPRARPSVSGDRGPLSAAFD
jgi:hypothetical protein